jgi:hypothetical protein
MIVTRFTKNPENYPCIVAYRLAGLEKRIPKDAREKEQILVWLTIKIAKEG